MKLRTQKTYLFSYIVPLKFHIYNILLIVFKYESWIFYE